MNQPEKEELKTCPNCAFRIEKIIDPIERITGYRCSLQGTKTICTSKDAELLECSLGLFEKG